MAEKNTRLDKWHDILNRQQAEAVILIGLKQGQKQKELHIITPKDLSIDEVKKLLANAYSLL